jgi:hypothetical protein
MHVAAHAVPQPNLLGKGCISLSDSCDLNGDLIPGTLLIVVALYVRERERVRESRRCAILHISGLKLGRLRKLVFSSALALKSLPICRALADFK